MPKGQPAAQYEPEIQRNTRWYNPTSDKLVLDMPDGVGMRGAPGRVLRFVVNPGEEVEIPDRFDRAIHQVNGRDEETGKPGVIVAGYGPRLVNRSIDPKMHPTLAAALDTDAEARRAAEAAMAAAQLQRRQAEDAQLIAAQRIAEVQASQAANAVATPNSGQTATPKPEEPPQAVQPQQQPRANGNQQRR